MMSHACSIREISLLQQTKRTSRHSVEHIVLLLRYESGKHPIQCCSSMTAEQGESSDRRTNLQSGNMRKPRECSCCDRKLIPHHNSKFRFSVSRLQTGGKYSADLLLSNVRSLLSPTQNWLSSENTTHPKQQHSTPSSNDQSLDITDVANGNSLELVNACYRESGSNLFFSPICNS